MNTYHKVTVLLEEAISEQINSGCIGVILEVVIPRLSFLFSQAYGFFDKNSSRSLTSFDLFRAASITKLITSTIVVYIASQHRWNLDDPVCKYLPGKIEKSLSKLKGLESVNKLTIRTLLSHRSGIPDYFFDEKFQDIVENEPDKIWIPEELVEAGIEKGELLFEPGTDFSYGDTAYVIAGIAIENLLEENLHDAYRNIIFNKLDMNMTYLEWREQAVANNLSHHYKGDKDLRYENISYDWAGGGLVTTANNLTKFLQGLFSHTLIDKMWTDEMIYWNNETKWKPHSSARYNSYGLGIGKNISYGVEIIGVTGVWGGFAYYCPEYDATITGTLNLVGADRPALMDAVIRAIKNLQL